jgi:hypothetical protein
LRSSRPTAQRSKGCPTWVYRLLRCAACVVRIGWLLGIVVLCFVASTTFILTSVSCAVTYASTDHLPFVKTPITGDSPCLREKKCFLASIKQESLLR